MGLTKHRLEKTFPRDVTGCTKLRENASVLSYRKMRTMEASHSVAIFYFLRDTFVRKNFYLKNCVEKL